MALLTLAALLGAFGVGEMTGIRRVKHDYSRPPVTDPYVASVDAVTKAYQQQSQDLKEAQGKAEKIFAKQCDAAKLGAYIGAQGATILGPYFIRCAKGTLRPGWVK